MNDYDFSPRPNPLKRCPGCDMLAPTRDGACVLCAWAESSGVPLKATLVAEAMERWAPKPAALPTPPPAPPAAVYGPPHADPDVEREARRRAGPPPRRGNTNPWRTVLERQRELVAFEKANPLAAWEKTPYTRSERKAAMTPLTFRMNLGRPS